MRPLSPADVCAAVIHYGDRDRTLRTIELLQSLDPAPGVVLVVDNGPDFDDPWPTTSTTRRSNAGFAGGVNQAVDFADAHDYRAVWILNNDVDIAPHALRSLMAAFDVSPDAEVVGSVVTMDQGTRVWFGGGSFDPGTGRASHQNYGEHVSDLDFTGAVRATTWVSGCSMVIPTHVFAQRGPFDENFFLYKEELEWQLRGTPVRAVLVDEPLLDHEVGATTGSTDGRVGRGFMCRNGLIMARRRAGLQRLRWLAAWAVDYVARPLAKGRIRELGSVWFALRTARMTGSAAMEVMQ